MGSGSFPRSFTGARVPGRLLEPSGNGRPREMLTHAGRVCHWQGPSGWTECGLQTGLG